jgi:hypothetical protein
MSSGQNLTIGAIASGLAVLLFGYICSAYISTNFRQLAARKGWDNHFVRAWDIIEMLSQQKLREKWWLWLCLRVCGGLGIALLLLAQQTEPLVNPAPPARHASPVELLPNTVVPEDIPRLREALNFIESMIGSTLAKNVEEAIHLIENWKVEIKSRGTARYTEAVVTIATMQEDLAGLLSVQGMFKMGKFGSVIALPKMSDTGNNLHRAAFDFISSISASVTNGNVNQSAVDYLGSKADAVKRELIEFSSWQYAAQARIDMVRKANGIK